MSFKILATTSSFFDSAGSHQEKLKATGYEIVSSRGPHDEAQLLELIGDGQTFDGFLCGEDNFSAKIIETIAPKAKVISKYGVGLDKIDLETAQRLGIQVTNTPGANHTSVAELTFGLLFSLARKIPEENNLVHKTEWRRFTGVELAGKTLGVFGFGRVGKEVARRAMAFGMKVLVYNTSWGQGLQTSLDQLAGAFADPVFSEFPPSIERVEDDMEALGRCDFVSLHMNLTKTNSSYLSRRRIFACKRGAFVINVSRGGLVDPNAMAQAIRSGHIAGYGADVLDVEPVTPNHPLIGLHNVHLTPHIGSRTRDSVERQGIAAVVNLVRVLEGEEATSRLNSGK
jgi:D-3-phosphoglycerate dehydrogenase